MDHTMWEVLRWHPNMGVVFQYHHEGGWLDAEDVTWGARIVCWLCPDNCALCGSSEAELQPRYNVLAEVFAAGGLLVSISKTEASVYRPWISASGLLDAKPYHADWSKVEESTTFENPE